MLTHFSTRRDPSITRDATAQSTALAAAFDLTSAFLAGVFVFFVLEFEGFGVDFLMAGAGPCPTDFLVTAGVGLTGTLVLMWLRAMRFEDGPPDGAASFRLVPQCGAAVPPPPATSPCALVPPPEASLCGAIDASRYT